MPKEAPAFEPTPQSIYDDQGVIPEGLAAPGSRQPSDFWFNRFQIDLSTGEGSYERIRCEDMEDVMGGTARGFKQLERHPVDDPYDPAALLMLNLGILSGTEFMTGLRTFFHAYSPLKASVEDKPAAMWTAGSGKFGTKLRTLDVDEVIFSGRSDKPVYLRISAGEDGVPNFTLGDASELVGLRVNAKIQKLHSLFPEAHFAVLGPAGENYKSVSYAAIALSTENQLKSGDMKSRFCGRGGIGGVMGSKNLLAIVADTADRKMSKGAPMLKDMNQLVARGEGSRRFRDKKRNDGGGGTWANVEGLHPVSAMPEFNFVPTGDKDLAQPLYRSSFEAAEFVVKDEACFRCGIRCHKNVYEKNEDGKAGKYLAKLDFEPLILMSSNLGIYDQHQTCELVELVDDLGMDSISIGVTLSYAMEFNKRHASDGLSVAGGLSYGDFEATRDAVLKIGSGQLQELGQGSKRLSETTGETGYAMHCKGVEFPAYLPQTNPGYPWALAGGHMSMKTYLLLLHERETGMDYWVDAITNRGPHIMRDDIIGICKFAGTTNEHMAEAITAMTGLALTPDELSAFVMRTYLRGYKIEKLQGFGKSDYVMPSEVHREYPQVDLPHFNSLPFFRELQGKVCERFDTMLTESGL